MKTKINSFKTNRTSLKVLREEINAALKIVEAKYNVALNIGNISYDDQSFTTRLSCNLIDTSNIPIVRSINISNPYKDKQFYYGGTLYTVVDFKPSRPKYPLVATGPRGGRYKFPLNQTFIN